MGITMLYATGMTLIVIDLVDYFNDVELISTTLDGHVFKVLRFNNSYNKYKFSNLYLNISELKYEPFYLMPVLGLNLFNERAIVCSLMVETPDYTLWCLMVKLFNLEIKDRNFNEIKPSLYKAYKGLFALVGCKKDLRPIWSNHV